MDKNDRLYGLRNIRAFLMIDATRGIYPTPAAVRMWMPAIESAIAELAKDETVALELPRAVWERLFTCMRAETPDARMSGDYYWPLKKLSEQLKAKIPE